MVRTLVLISIASLVLCIAAFTAAFAIAGGPFAIHDWRIDRDWSFSDGMEHHHGRHHRFHDSFALDTDEAGAHATRDFTWSGGDRLRVEVPADIVAAEKDVQVKKTLAEGKPEAAVEKIVEGRLGAFFKDIVLLEQESVTEAKKSVKQVLDEAGTTVKRFARFEVGA